LTNRRKAAYNRIYNRTTIDLFALGKGKKSGCLVILARYGNNVVRDADNRVKLAVTEALSREQKVDIWASLPVATLDLGEHSLKVPASKPLEEHLVRVLSPDFNVKKLR
jgi:hypothetical protein